MNPWIDAIGYLAAFLLVATFFMRDMTRLRIVAICSSVAWLGYGLLGVLYPIIVLHSVLLPVNGYRLWQGLRRPESPSSAIGAGPDGRTAKKSRPT